MGRDSSRSRSRSRTRDASKSRRVKDRERSRSRGRERSRDVSSSSNRRGREYDRGRERSRSRSRGRDADRKPSSRDPSRDKGREQSSSRSDKRPRSPSPEKKDRSLSRSKRDRSDRPPRAPPEVSRGRSQDKQHKHRLDRSRSKHKHRSYSRAGAEAQRKDKSQADAEVGQAGAGFAGLRGGENGAHAESKAAMSMEQGKEQALDEGSLALLALDPEEEENRLIEERKRKRQMIMEQYKRKQDEQQELDNFATGRSAAEAEEVEMAERKRRREGSGPQATSPAQNGAGRAAGQTPQKGTASKEEDEDDDQDESAVDVRVHHKPLSDTEEERDARSRKAEAPGDEQQDNGVMLDMFSFSPSKALFNLMPTEGVLGTAAIKGVKDAGDHLEDNWDDHDGYYRTLVGELMADRYLVLGAIGRGVFSTVLRCQDKRNNDLQVAIKLIRNNEVMRKAANRELDLLRAIAAADPDNKKHCVRLLNQFEHRNHVAMVFESMQMNLRETLRKFGKHVGINISAVRVYAKQLLVALKHIGNLKIVHADIKPDNILVSEGFSQLKLCDFGSAFREDAPDNDPTPYLVSRFYRAPEIILGFEYDRSIDLWSIGCCLYELFTGRVAFSGVNNNDMMRLMMEVKGGLPSKVMKRHRAAYEKLQLEPFFEPDGRFRQQETDPVTKKPIMRIVHVTKPTKDLVATLMKAKDPKDDRMMVHNLADMLEKIFVVDPSKRITVKEALQHPFVSSHHKALA